MLARKLLHGFPYTLRLTLLLIERMGVRVLIFCHDFVIYYLLMG